MLVGVNMENWATNGVDVYYKEMTIYCFDYVYACNGWMGDKEWYFRMCVFLLFVQVISDPLAQHDPYSYQYSTTD